MFQTFLRFMFLLTTFGIHVCKISAATQKVNSAIYHKNGGNGHLSMIPKIFCHIAPTTRKTEIIPTIKKTENDILPAEVITTNIYSKASPRKLSKNHN